MIVSLIVAIDEDNGIGKDNKLPWHLPADLKHFKTLTTGHTIVMGRKTFDSIGKPLPNRRNIIISRQQDLAVEGTEVVQSLPEALNLCEDENEIFIIGGAQIFKYAMPLANILYLTIIHHTFEADTFFPEIDQKNWIEEQRTKYRSDDKNNYPYTFIKYRKA
jgi:dihydrofolate reductase